MGDLILRKRHNYKSGLIDWIGKVKEILGRDPEIGIEIGTFRGESAQIFREQGVKHIICVDPYLPYGKIGKNQIARARRTFLDSIRDDVGVSFLHMSSEDAAKILKGKFDFIYIDGNHDYRPVKKDIRLWDDKATVLGGHDFTDPGFTGVRAAVKELAKGREIITFDDTSWMYVSK